MKYCIIVMLIFVVLFSFSGCKNEVTIESETQTEAASVTKMDDVDSVVDAEQFTGELNDPDFDFPPTFAEVESFMNLPSYTKTDKNALTEKFYSDKNLVFEKIYDESGNVSVVTVYDEGNISVVYEFDKDDDGQSSVDIDWYGSNDVILRRKFIYHSSGVIKYIYSYATDPESGAPIVEMFGYDENGILSTHVDSDSFNQIVLDSILGQLAG